MTTGNLYENLILRDYDGHSPKTPSKITDWKEYLERARFDFNARYPFRVHYAVTFQDFFFIRTVGEGAFGRVMVVKKKSSGQYYAAKLLEKRQLVLRKGVQHAYTEKKILKSIRFPFTIHLEYFFQDNAYLFFILPFLTGGDLFSLLRKESKFHEDISKFYASQILLALEYLHYVDLIYRDLKPENVIIDSQGYLKLTDFGFCKKLRGRTYTFCGTPEYIAPEIIVSRGYGRSADFWAFGVFIYELNCGYTPFYSRDPLRIYEKAVEGKYRIHPEFSSDLRDIIRHLIEVDITKRYGILRQGIDDIKSHDWFKKVYWLAILNKSINAPFIPVPFSLDRSDVSIIQERPLKKLSTDYYKSEFADF